MRRIERTMATHSRSIVKQTKKKSIKQHVKNVLQSGFLSNEESVLLQNTLELMKILSKIKRYIIKATYNIYLVLIVIIVV